MKEFIGAALGGIVGGAIVSIGALWWIIRKIDV